MVNNRRLLAAAAAVCSAATLTLAQTPAAGTRQNPTAADQETVRPTVTLVGCLYREDQVPGRKPNIAERAGILEDYILAGASEVDAASGTPGATGTSGTAGATPVTNNMYKVDGPPDDQLKALVGKRVSVTGRIDPEGRADNATGGPQPDRGLGPDTISLPDIKASSIAAASGTCPATPAPLKP